MEKNNKTYAIFILICILAVVLRVWMIQAHLFLGGDGVLYRLIAFNILNGHGFSNSFQAPFTPTDYRAPLYPLFITFCYNLFGRSDYNVLYLQVFIDIFSCILVFLMAKHLYNIKVGLIATFFVAIYISSIALTASLHTEPLYFFLILLCTWLIIDYPVTSNLRIFFRNCFGIGNIKPSTYHYLSYFSCFNSYIFVTQNKSIGDKNCCLSYWCSFSD